jgi:hypothetical protein
MRSCTASYQLVQNTVPQATSLCKKLYRKLPACAKNTVPRATSLRQIPGKQVACLTTPDRRINALF